MRGLVGPSQELKGSLPGPSPPGQEQLAGGWDTVFKSLKGLLVGGRRSAAANEEFFDMREAVTARLGGKLQSSGAPAGSGLAGGSEASILEHMLYHHRVQTPVRLEDLGLAPLLWED